MLRINLLTDLNGLSTTVTLVYIQHKDKIGRYEFLLKNECQDIFLKNYLVSHTEEDSFPQFYEV